MTVPQPMESTTVGRPRSRAVAIVVLIVIAVAGAAAGVAADRYVLIPRGIGHTSWVGHRISHRMPNASKRKAMQDRLARLLGLTPAQRTRVDSIMTNSYTATRSAHESIRPRVDSIFAQTRRAIDSALTPTQRAKLEQLRRDGTFGRMEGGRRLRDHRRRE